jgi:hypothetical protein
LKKKRYTLEDRFFILLLFFSILYVGATGLFLLMDYSGSGPAMQYILSASSASLLGFVLLLETVAIGSMGASVWGLSRLGKKT